jgi:hypothetical protein
VIFSGLHLLVTAAALGVLPSTLRGRTAPREPRVQGHAACMPVAHDANAAYSVWRSDAKATPPVIRRITFRRQPATRERPGAGKFRVHPTGTKRNATLIGMDHQGAGRDRRAADTRRQSPWPPPEGGGSSSPSPVPDSRDPAGTGPQPAPTAGYGAGTGAQRILGPGTGGQRLLSPGTGPQRLVGSGSGAQPRLGTGPQPRLGPGTGAQPRLGPGTGAQPRLGPGTGAHRVLGPGTGPGRQVSPGSGPQPTLGTPGAAGSTGSFERTPTRGFPPGREPTGPMPVGGYRADDTGPTGTLTADTAGQPATPGRRRGGGPKRSRRFRVGWLVTAVVVAAAAGFACYKFLYEPRVNAPVPSTFRLPTSAPGSPGFDKTLGKWQHIGTRAEDPQALTITELYPPQFVLNGASYVRTAAGLTKTCSLAVYGTNLQAALQSGHCSQVARASYISGDGTMMGTVGVVNLISSSAAQKAGQVTGPQQIIAPLTGKKGATSKLGNGTGVVQAEIKGHYLILMWAEYANLKSPSGSAQRQALEQFAENLVTGSANIDLSTRMLTGKP